jgi:hypothetical protein
MDSAQRSSVAGFAGRVSFAVDLLAEAAGLGKAGDLAGDLARLSGRIE